MANFDKPYSNLTQITSWFRVIPSRSLLFQWIVLRDLYQDIIVLISRGRSCRFLLSFDKPYHIPCDLNHSPSIHNLFRIQVLLLLDASNSLVWMLSLILSGFFWIYLSVHLSIYLSYLILSYLYLSIYLSLCLSLSVSLSLCLSACLSIYLSISLSLSLSLCLSLSVCLPVCPSIYLQAWKCSRNVRWKVFDLNAPRVSLPLLPAVYPNPVPSRSLGCSFARKWARTVGRFVASVTPAVSRSPLISTTSLRNGDGWIMRMQWKFIGTYWSMNGT